MPPVAKSVRVVYMVPGDRQERSDYRGAVEQAVREVQTWFFGELAGRTFRLNQPIVEVFGSRETAAWYNTNQPPGVTDPAVYTFYNAYNELNEALGLRFFDDNYVWVVYIDAAGGTGAGSWNVAILPEHDLLGLIGQNPNDPRIARWHGGLGHEVGHAFGLPHPDPSERDALMQFGYLTFPRAYLTDGNRTDLANGTFLHLGNPGTLTAAVYAYDAAEDSGYFIHFGGDAWEERKTHRRDVIAFVRSGEEDQFFHLHDPARGAFWIALPKTGSRAFWSMEAGVWHPFHEMRY